MIDMLVHLHGVVERRLAAYPDIGLLILRLTVAGHMLWAAQLHVFSWTRFVGFGNFLETLNFPWPKFLAFVAIGSLVVCGIAFVLGACTRLAAAVMVIYFVVAAAVDASQPYPAAYAALVTLAAVFCLMFAGAGRWSIDRQWRARHSKSLNHTYSQ